MTAGGTEGRVTVIVPPTERGTRVDTYLARCFPEVSRTEIQRWLRLGRVLNGERPLRPKDKLNPGMALVVSPAAPPATRAEPDPSVPVDVVWEDEHLLVVNKAAGVVVHPARGNWSGTLVNGLLARPGFGRPTSDERDPEGAMRPGVVHRIDKDTSGLLVVAKTPQAREGLKDQFAEHQVHRRYLALTLGIPVPASIKTLHGRHPSNRLKFSSHVQSGKEAVTHLEVVERFAQLGALVRCRLETGRTHQIRVHLLECASTPLLGDSLYGGHIQDAALRQLSVALGRQALHAAELGFAHPVSGQQVLLSAPLPDDMERALTAFRALALGAEAGEH